jgi:hypothetical protein
VKSLLAMLVGLALVLSQTALVAGMTDFGSQPPTVPKCCGHCSHCKGNLSCCAARNTPQSPSSVPAVPAHNLTQNDWQVLVAATVSILPAQSAEARVISAPVCLPQSAAAPLYQRNCSYLI